jgi:hypothetical protein
MTLIGSWIVNTDTPYFCIVRRCVGAIGVDAICYGSPTFFLLHASDFYIAYNS